MAAEGFAEYAPTDWRALRGDSRLAHAIEGALIGGTTAVIMGGGTEGFVNGAKSGAMSRLFNYCGEHGNNCDDTDEIVTVEEVKPVDLNGQNITNPIVIQELNNLALGLAIEGYGHLQLVVTGGSSYWDYGEGGSVSLSNYKLIPQRKRTSGHHTMNGARDVDIRGGAIKKAITHEKFERIVHKYTKFRRVSKWSAYQKTNHIHLGLPNIKANSCYKKEGC